MSVPSHPSGYDVTKDVPTSRIDCHITVGFDRQGTHLPRFLVCLHHTTSFSPVQWTSIARADHNETGASGHDIYREGLHIDVSKAAGDEVKLYPSQTPLPTNRGKVIRACVEYFDREAGYFVDVYNGSVSPANPPGWPDGGEHERPRKLIRPKHILRGMRPEPRGEETVSKEELNEVLAEATGTSAEEIEAAAEEIEIGPPEEADVVDE